MEMLVVIAIIALLMALLIPAVGSAREAARRTQCSNNLRQIGTAIVNFESQLGALPPGFAVTGTNTEPAWGWAVYILPFLEEQNLYSQLNPGGRNLADLFRSGAAATDVALLQRPLAGYRCPSDDAPALNTLCKFGSGHYAVATANYVANGGSHGRGSADPPCVSNASTTRTDTTSGAVTSLGCSRLMLDAYCAPFIERALSPPRAVDPGGAFFGVIATSTSGVAPIGIPLASVLDGTSNTLAVGERRAFNYAAAWAGAGWAHSYGNEGTARTLGRPSFGFNTDYIASGSPENQSKGFSAPHPQGGHFVYLDGSVRFCTESISSTLLSNMGNRRDGRVFNDF